VQALAVRPFAPMQPVFTGWQESVMSHDIIIALQLRLLLAD
jgi:hypothetical protein